MQSKTWLLPLIGSAIVSAACWCIGVRLQSGTAAVLLTLLAGWVLGFVHPRGAWRWAVVLALWIAAGILFGPHLQPAPQWCTSGLWVPKHEVSPNMLLVVPFVAVAFGVAADRLVTFIVFKLAFLHLPLLDYAQPVLRIAALTCSMLLVLWCAFMLVQPLQPYAIGQTYCWDEYCFVVTAVERTKVIGAGARRAVAKGTFYIVKADFEAPWWGRFVWSNDAVYVTDYQDNSYEYSRRGQLADDRLSGSNRSRCHLILGARERETVVFDLPNDVEQPRLLVRDTLGFEGLLGGIRSNLIYVKPAFNLRYD